jgi:predicted transcriptional regulator
MSKGCSAEKSDVNIDLSRNRETDMGSTLEEIATELGMTRQGVNRIIKNALRKARRICEERGLDAETCIEILRIAEDRETVWDRIERS